MEIRIIREPIQLQAVAEAASGQFGDMIKAVVDVERGVMRHAGLAAGRWSQLTLSEQLGNVGSEVGRALRWKEKNPGLHESAMIRALELLDMTLQDSRWRGRSRELARARELLCDAWLGGKEYGSSLAAMDRYFFPFALHARKSR